MPDTDTVSHARNFLLGEHLQFAEANELWKRLKDEDQLSLARQVLRHLREKPLCLSDGAPKDTRTREILCRQEALLTSRDPELDSATRHDEALNLLANEFEFIENKKLGGDEETLGIAGGICKRRWNDLGQLKDLVQAAEFYERAAKNELGDDAYPHINAAFLEDLLAAAGDRPAERRDRANKLRERIQRDLPVSGTWFNAATHAEALFGLGRYAEATEALRRVGANAKPALWELRTMAEQLAQLAYLREELPLEHPSIRMFFETLLPGASDTIRSVTIGKVGLALSGGGFRASFYHLGVLACLAERDVLRDLEVLSCVSGGSIVGACYWLKLRQRMLKSEPMQHESYVELVRELISHFQDAVGANLRRQVQPHLAQVVWRFLSDKRGVLDPEKIADALEEYFYRPLWPDDGPIQMDQLAFSPKDHDAALTGSEEFNPAKHNWLRAHKVPALILNATTVNTGHAWRFTPTWMGESPWSIHESADSIPRLEWSKYDKSTGWQIRLARAVAASACVPMVFAPLRIGQYYGQGIEISLVDGAVHDNQGSVSLLASGCNVIIVSDACAQLMLEPAPVPGLKGLRTSTLRFVNTLMERVRLANFADLESRRRSGLLRGLTFIHMKAGLDADVIRLRFSHEASILESAPLSPSGVRKDFQRALSEMRTDLDAFTTDEANGLMACGYQMASKGLDRDLPKLHKVWRAAPRADWPFQEMLAEITSVAATTLRRDDRLAALRAAHNVDVSTGSLSRLVRTPLPLWGKVKSFLST
ncbi:MAG TPA: patatin-like phospholipase family protein [Pseudolabrys sp.]|nr:patatin-like phospholipase family protein [Pseudolabrys sp.]